MTAAAKHILVILLMIVALGLLCALWTQPVAAGESLSPRAVTQDEPWIMFFTADWCPHCRATKPAIIAMRQLGFPVAIVDVDEPATPANSNRGGGGASLAQRYGIKTIPATLVVSPTSRIRAGEREIAARYQNELTLRQLQDIARKHGLQAKKSQ